MDHEKKRIVEVRMLLIALVDASAPSLAETLAATPKNPSSVAEVVASEAVSNLESLAYIEAAYVSVL